MELKNENLDYLNEYTIIRILSKIQFNNIKHKMNLWKLFTLVTIKINILKSKLLLKWIQFMLIGINKLNNYKLPHRK